MTCAEKKDENGGVSRGLTREKKETVMGRKLFSEKGQKEGPGASGMVVYDKNQISLLEKGELRARGGLEVDLGDMLRTIESKQRYQQTKKEGRGNIYWVFSEGRTPYT